MPLRGEGSISLEKPPNTQWGEASRAHFTTAFPTVLISVRQTAARAPPFVTDAAVPLGRAGWGGVWRVWGMHVWGAEKQESWRT